MLYFNIVNILENMKIFWHLLKKITIIVCNVNNKRIVKNLLYDM